MALLCGPLLPAAAGQASSERETTSESSLHPAKPIRQGLRRPTKVVDCEAVPQTGVDPSLEYLEEWQHSHAGGKKKKVAAAAEPFPGAAAPGVKAAEFCPYVDSSLKPFLPAADKHREDRLLLAYTKRTLSPASEDGLLSATGGGSALSQASTSSRRDTRCIRRPRRSSRRGFTCVPPKNETSGVVAAACDEHHRGAVEDTLPGWTSSSSCSSSVCCLRQLENSEHSRKKDTSYWREAQAGWPTVWRCPNTSLYSLQRGLLGLLFLTCCAYSMCILSVVSDQFYDPEKGPSRLHDRIHDQMLSSQPFWLATPALVDIVTVGLLLVTAVRHIMFIPYSIGFLVLYRFLFLLGAMYMLRGVAMVITTVPPSKKHCEPPRIHRVSDLFCFSVQQCLNMRRECTGMIISGHSITTCCSMAIWLLYGDAPAVSPLQNMRAACADVAAALRVYWGKRRKRATLDDAGEISESRDTDERTTEEQPPPKEEEGRTVAGRKSSAVAAMPDECVQIPSPPTFPDASVATAQGQRQQQRRIHAEAGKREGEGPLRRCDEQQSGRKQRWEVVAQGRETVLRVVGGQSWEQQQQEEDDEAGAGEEGPAPQANESEDQEMKKQETTKAPENNTWKGNAGSRSSWSTVVDIDGRIARSAGDAAAVWRHGDDSLNDQRENTMLDVAAAERGRRNGRALEAEQTQQSPLLDQQTSAPCWQRYCGWLTWQCVREKLWTASLLRLVCLLIGCTNLLFIVLSFNHYTVDVFMAINFTLGAWSFYHFVVALLWNERLTKKCFSAAASASAAVAAAGAGLAPGLQQQLQQGPAAAKVHQTEDDEEMESRDVTNSSGATEAATQEEEQGNTGFTGDMYTERQKERCMRSAAGGAKTGGNNSSSACCRCNGESGDTTKRKNAAAGEKGDTLTDGPSTTATPDTQMLPALLHVLEGQSQGCNSSSSSKTCGCSSPAGSASRSNVKKSSGAAGDNWLLGIKATPQDSLSPSTEEQQGDCDVTAALSVVCETVLKASESRGIPTDEEPRYYSSHPGDSSAALSSSGGALLLGRKGHKHASHVLFSCPKGRRSCGAAGSNSSSVTAFSSENNAFTEAAACGFMRGSWRTLHLPLLKPAINAVRCLEGM